MHDLNKAMFYKTSFDVRSVDEEGDALWSLICSLRLWATRKYPALPREASFWSALKQTHRAEEAGVRFRSELCLEGEGPSHWALAIEEVFAEPDKAPRHWTTEVTFAWTERRAGHAAIALSYGDRPGFLGPCQPRPSCTTPGFIRTILENDRLACTSSGRAVSLDPRELRVGDFKAFWELVSDEARETPVIYVSPRFDGDEARFAVAPQRIAASLGPSAFVFFSQDRAFVQEMGALIPDLALRCDGGTVRVYATRPRMADGRDRARHRFFLARDIEAMGEDDFVLLLRRALAQDVHFYEDMMRADAVKRRRGRLVFERQVRDRSLSDAFALVEKAEGDRMTAEELMEDLSQENEQLERRCDELKAALYVANAKAEALEGQAARAGGAEPGVGALGRFPLSYDAVALLFREHYGERIDFTDRARKSFGTCITEVDLVWNALRDLCEIAHPLYADGEAGDLVKAFNSRSEFTLKRGVGMMTRKDGRLMEQYVEVYQGREIKVETHLAKGSDDSSSRSLRLYFGFDRESGRIVVSSVGKHLDSYLTRSMR